MKKAIIATATERSCTSYAPSHVECVVGLTIYRTACLGLQQESGPSLVIIFGKIKFMFQTQIESTNQNARSVICNCMGGGTEGPVGGNAGVWRWHWPPNNLVGGGQAPSIIM